MTQLETEKPAARTGVGAGYVLNLYWQKSKRYPISGFSLVFSIFLAGLFNLWTPLYYKKFFDVLTGGQTPSEVAPQLLTILFIVLALNLAAWVFWRIATFANSYFQASMMADLKQDAFAYMLGHSYTFFANTFTGSLVQKVNRYARAFERLADRLTWDIIPLVVRIGGVTVILFFLNHTLTYVLLGWLVIFVGCNYAFARWKLKYDIQGAAADSRTTAVLSDAISNSNTIQLFSGADSEKKNFKDVSEVQAKLQIFRWNLGAIVEAIQVLLIIAMEFLIFFYALKFWALGLVTIGFFVMIQAYFIDLVAKLWDFSRIIRDVYESFADAKEMAEILARPHDIRNLPQARPLALTKGEIEFKNTLFNYNETRVVLNKINLKLEQGTRVALIGPSGAGKSTFFRLLLRFYEPTGGKILIDGQDIQHVTQESLRDAISLVPQDPLLFHRTLKENIRYGKRDATDEEVFTAARLAHCDEFALNLPKGYDTYVGERGIKLSGGERQRVAIARAILKNAPILLLDEATSSLDSHSEGLIQDALANLMRGKTTIAIAHRLSTIKNMDRIIVLDKGNISEQGTHDELLLNSAGIYRKLWTLQSGGFLQVEETAPTE